MENPEILEELTGKVNEIIENPMQFAKVFIQNENVEDTCQVKKEETVPNSMLTSSVKGAKAAEEHLCGQLKETVFKGDDKQRRRWKRFIKETVKLQLIDTKSSKIFFSPSARS